MQKVRKHSAHTQRIYIGADLKRECEVSVEDFISAPHVTFVMCCVPSVHFGLESIDFYLSHPFYCHRQKMSSENMRHCTGFLVLQ